jgi:hypothetical protein
LFYLPVENYLNILKKYVVTFDILKMLMLHVRNDVCMPECDEIPVNKLYMCNMIKATETILGENETNITVGTAHKDIPPAPHICPTYFHNQNITDCSYQK